MATPYRQVFTDDALSNLSSRLATYQNGLWINAVNRNPAYCVVTGEGVTVPQDTISFESTYSKGDFRKADPLLKSVTITQNASGDTKLIIEADVTIQCHTKTQFEKLETAFCKNGKLVSFTWGYKNPRGPGYGSKSIDGFTVSTYSFNTTPEGFWIINFKAIAPGITIEQLAVNFKVDTSKKREFKLEGKTYPVTSLIELITYWAQANGQRAIDDAKNGEVIKPDMGVGAIVIYDPEHLHSKDGIAGGIARVLDASQNNETTKTNNIVYITLETLIEMINRELLPEYGKTVTAEQKAEFNKLKLKFHSEYSFSYVDTECRSAMPTKVLILGANDIGNYKNEQKKGKDFLEGVTNPAAITAATAGPIPGRNTIDLKKILIERTVVLSALSAVFKEDKPAEKINAKTIQEGSVKIKEVFQKIFQAIKEATGDTISLVLSMSPEVYTKGAKSAYDLYVFDENNGYTSRQEVWVLNPIDGDGTTRSCEIKSEVGSETFQAAAFSATLKQNDAVSEANGEIQNGTNDGRSKNYKEAKQKIKEIIKSPGTLGDSAFDNTHMQALRDQLNTLRHGAPESKGSDLMIYPGLGITAELDGIWGIHPGCGIFTTQLPMKYRNNNTYFFVSSVTQTFSGESSDWSTKLEGMLTMFKEVDYKP